MEYTEEEYLMISGIQHFKFCRRQWALIHIEQQWEENVHTVVGELMHKKAHDPYLKEKRKEEIFYDKQKKDHYMNHMFHGYDMDRTMLRI